MSRENRSLTLDVVKNTLCVDAEVYTTAEGALNADARFVAPVVDGLPEELSSSSGPITRSFQTARAPRGSSAKYLHSFSPVEDMRKRLREVRAPLLGTKTQMWRRLLEREAMERRHLDDQALLDRRRYQENEIDPTVPRTLKGPDAPTESERTAHEITPTSWCETCLVGRGIETPHGRLTPSERDEKPFITMNFAVIKARAEDGGVDDDLGTLLAIIGSSTGCMRAVSAETEGVTDCHASSMADSVKHLFIGRLRLRCDNESSIKAVAENVKAKMPDRVLENKPRYSSTSNALAERVIRTVSEQLRTSRYGTQNRYKTRITLESTFWPWLIGHAGFCVTRYARGAGGITPFRAAYDRDYTQENCSICRNCLVQDHGVRASWIVVGKETP